MKNLISKYSLFILLFLVTKVTGQCDVILSNLVLDQDHDCQELSYNIDFSYNFESCPIPPTQIRYANIVDVSTGMSISTSFGGPTHNLSSGLIGQSSFAMTSPLLIPLYSDLIYYVEFYTDASNDPIIYPNINGQRLLDPQNLTFACENSVNVSLDGQCQALVDVHTLLAGNYCRGYFEYQSEDSEGNVLYSDDDGFIQFGSPGTYEIMVSSVEGTRCWSTLELEDKLPLTLDCGLDTVQVRCSQSVSPGTPIDIERKQFSILDTTIIGTGTCQMIELDFELNPLELHYLIHQASVFITAEFDTLSDLQLELISLTDSDTFSILDFSNVPCTLSNIDLTFTKNAIRTHQQLLDPDFCGQSEHYAFAGQYLPIDELSNLINKDTLQNEWKIVMTYCGATNLYLQKVGIDLDIYTQYIPIPFENYPYSYQGENTYIISSPNDNCGPYSAQYIDTEIQACSDDTLSQTIERYWTITNTNSDNSSHCTHTIQVKNITTLFDPISSTELAEDQIEIIYPPHYDGMPGNQDALSCNIIFLLNDGSLNLDNVSTDTLPLPALTGYPKAKFGDIKSCDHIDFQYSDTRFENCGPFSFKILRDWVLVDWCNGDSYESSQIIKIIDNEGPVINCKNQDNPLYSIIMDPNKCSADWDIPLPTSVHDCKIPMIDYDLNVSYYTGHDQEELPQNAVFITDNIQYQQQIPVSISDLPAGHTWIKYEVQDLCGNIGECIRVIKVKDEIVPTPVCVEILSLSFGSNGCAIAEAISFDKESYDNCAVDSFAVRRVSNGGLFSDRVEFCCEDYNNGSLNNGQYHEVELKVIDVNGNENTCITKIELEDPIDIVIEETPPNLITIHCTDDLPLPQDFLDQFVIIDNLNQTNCPYSIEFEGPLEINPIDQCGNGTFQINYTISTFTGYEAFFSIIINIENQQIFDITNPNIWTSLNLDYQSEILEGCPTMINLDPKETILGYPTIPETSCSSLALSYTDQIFNDVQGACVKVLRNWTLIDWCTYDPAFPEENKELFIQVIKINDNVIPDVTCPVTVDTLFGFEPINCQLNTYDVDGNDILILDDSEIYDECSALSNQNLIVEFQIDYNRDGVNDYLGFGPNANDVHPFGCHTIYWQVIDHCGNINDACNYEFCILDNKPPTPYCMENLSISISNESLVDIWATEFDLGTTDNITGACNENELIYKIKRATDDELQDVITIDCNDFFNAENGMLTVELWVFDEFGNGDFCSANIFIQDNDETCSGTIVNESSLSGTIYTTSGEAITDQDIKVVSVLDNVEEVITTDQNGQFIGPILFSNQEYTLSSSKEDNILNGLSTLDLILIQRHILGITPFDSPYKIIAADANKNGAVSATDLIYLRKIILGINDSFPNDQTSWRSIDSSTKFDDLNKPFPYDEIITISNPDEDQYIDFLAIKIGDVNEDVILYLNEDNVESRNQSILTSGMINPAIINQNIPLQYEQDIEAYGFQLKLNFDQNQIKINALNSDVFDINENHYHIHDNGTITISYFQDEIIEIDSKVDFLNINIDLIDQDVNQLFTINEQIASEWYDADMVPHPMTIETIESQERLIVKQNYPNPFKNNTIIPFEISTDGEVMLHIYNTNGQVIYSESQYFQEGQHEFHVDLGHQIIGNLHYHIKSNDQVSINQMIKID